MIDNSSYRFVIRTLEDMNNLISKHIYILGFVLLFSCNTNKSPKENLADEKDLEWVEILDGIYGVPADSVKILKEMAKVRVSYSFKDMVNDYGHLDWYSREDDPFSIEHLYCEDDMLEDTLMYRLVDNLICSRDYYEGDLKSVYDWLWHDEMIAEIDTYLKTIYPDKEEFDDNDYLGVFDKMGHYVDPLCGGNNPEMRQCSQVWHYLSVLHLIGKYKEAILYAYPSKELAKAYLEDYRLWKKMFHSVVDANRPEQRYSLWPLEYHDCGDLMAQFRLEMLDEEIGYLAGEKNMNGVQAENKQKYHGDNTGLDRWFDMRKAMKDPSNAVWYSHMTYRIWNEFWKKEVGIWPKL